MSAMVSGTSCMVLWSGRAMGGLLGLAGLDATYQSSSRPETSVDVSGQDRVRIRSRDGPDGVRHPVLDCWAMAGARPTLLSAHGMYMNGKSWAPWVELAREAGFEPLVPSWPYHDGEPAELRRHIDPQLGRLTFGQVVRHYTEVIGTLAEPPLVIGHSVDGLVVQRLLNGGLVKAGVSISSAPPRGFVSLDPHFFRANLPHVNPSPATGR
jgi:pimeloyl-ACP methyl ester carboxylesterase